MAAPPPPPKGGGLSLYANLLNPKADAQATVSGAPVVYDNGKKEDAAVKKEVNQGKQRLHTDFLYDGRRHLALRSCLLCEPKLIAFILSALRFQPIRRPQIPQKKVAKPVFPKSIPTSSTGPDISKSNDGNVPRDATATPPPAQGGPPAQRSTLADWAATEEDEYMYGTAATEKRQRGGRKAKKKKQQKQGDNQRQETDWDEIYDPSRPTNVDEYMRSDERIREVQEWKAVLYAHRRRRRSSSESDEDSDADERPAMGSKLSHQHSGSYNTTNTTGLNRSIRSSGGLLLCTATHVAFSRFTSCCRVRAGRRNRRRCLRPPPGAVRHGCAATAASRSIFSCSSTTTIATTRCRDHLSRTRPLRSPSSATHTTAKRQR